MKRSLRLLVSSVLIISFAVAFLGFSTIAVKGIKLNASNITLNVGKTYVLKASFTPANTTQKILLYSTGNKSIAVVDKNGVIKGIKTGKTVVTVTSASNKMVLAKCNVTISQPKSSSSKITDKDILLKVIRWEHPNQPLRSDSPVLKEIYKKTGIKVELQGIPQANYNDKKKILLATNDIPHVMLVNQSDIVDFGSKGIFLSLLDKLENDAPVFKKLLNENPEMKNLYVDGQLYGFPISVRFAYRRGWVPMIRTDILKKLNLNVPETFDDLYVVLKRMKEAYPESYPYGVRKYGDNNLLQYLAYAMGSGYSIDGSKKVYYDKDIGGGKYVFGAIRPEFKDALVFANKLFKEKILDPDYSMNTQAQWQEKISKGKNLFYWENMSYGLAANSALKAENPEYKFEPIPVPKNKSGKSRNFYLANNFWSESYAINAKIKNRDIIVRFFDWLYSQQGTDITNFGVEGENYTKVNNEYIISQVLLDKHKVASNPYLSMQSELGTGYLAFTPYTDQTPQYAISDPVLINWYKIVGKDPAMVEPILDPPFNEEEREKLAKIRSRIDTFIAPEIDKFIMGTRSLSEFDDFVNQLKDKGALEMENIYNKAASRVK